MRIRKRFPPSSSLSSVFLSSDPLLTRSVPLHQLQSSTDSQPSDPPNQPHSNRTVIGSEKPRWELQHKELDGDEVKDERWSDEEKNNHIIRKSSNLGQDSSILPPSGSDQVERWFEGDKVIPLKKRIVREETNYTEDQIDKKMKGKMKSKTNKKCARPYSTTDEQKEEGSEKSKSKSGNCNNINKRGSGIMEGSRCSRVNGRGWRCSQQTLVGYSLCEHHLGKGRLRSMSSVRSRAVARVAPKKPEPEPELEPLMDDVYDDSDDDGGVMVRKKRIGMVKARSIRSLLGQTDSGASGVHVVADDDDDDNI